jgi:predicted nucleotidyltransferase
MDARPLLARIARMLEEHGLEAVLIGNAAAALQGAPVTTIDFDFMFRKTPANLRKLKALAAALDAVILRPYYPASDLFRIVRDEDGLQLDFMSSIHGVRSLASLRSRAKTIPFGDARILVASLSDIIKSKRSAGRPRDIAVLEVLEKALHEEAANHKEGQAGRSEERE